jgi:hypothetical protein
VQNTAIKLTNDEWEVLNDTSFFVHKRAVFSKFDLLFHRFGEIMQKGLKSNVLPVDKYIANKRGRLSRGENYLGLPYMVFDYPRIGGNDELFTFRSMLWWGKYFSFNLVIAGKMLEEMLPCIEYKKSYREILINRGENLWNHDLQSADYVRLDEKVLGEVLERKKFLRLGYALPLERWTEFEAGLFREP